MSDEFIENPVVSILSSLQQLMVLLQKFAVMIASKSGTVDGKVVINPNSASEIAPDVEAFINWLIKISMVKVE